MNPVRKAAVLGLLEWIRRNRPQITSLSSLSREEFMDVVRQYELGKGVKAIEDPHSDLRAKWQSAHMWISHYKSDREALEDYPG
jgi:hypothetical protein